MNRRTFIKKGLLFVPAIAASPCFGQSPDGLISGAFDNLVTITASPYILSEGFEGTGYENPGWLDSGSPDPNYTSLVLNGSQSWSSTLYADNSVFDLGTAYDTLYFYFLFRRASAPSLGPIFQVLDASDNVIAAIAAGGGSGYVLNGSFTSAFATLSNTTYSAWLQYTKGSGANGISNAWIATTTTKPGSPTASITNGTATTQAKKIRLHGGANWRVYMDFVRVSSSSIGSAPS